MRARRPNFKTRFLKDRAIWVWLTIAILGSFTGTSLAEDSFDTLRDSVRIPSSAPAALPPPPNNSGSSAGQTPWFGDPTSSTDSWGALGFFVLAAPFTVPQAIADDHFNSTGYFARFPYDADLAGSMVIDNTDDQPQRWSTLRARAEYAANFGGGEREGIQFLYDTLWRVGIDSDNNYRSHVLLNGRRDSVTTGDTNVVIRFAQTETWQMRAGLGVNWLADSHGSNGGVNFTYGGDWFPIKPWVFSTEIDAGSLGNAGLFHFRTSVGVLLQRYEIYTGYDYYDVGRFQSQGIMSGIRLWF